MTASPVRRSDGLFYTPPVAPPNPNSKPDPLIKKHQTAYNDYLRLCKAIWGLHSNGDLSNLDSDYSPSEMPKLKDKWMEICKQNICLATMLGGLQKLYREYLREYEAIIHKTSYNDLFAIAQRTSAFHSAVSSYPGLEAKVRYLGSLFRES